MAQATSRKQQEDLSAADRTFLRKLIEKHELAATARLLGISRGVIASAVGGLPMRRGSLSLLRAALVTERKKTVA